MLGRRVWWGFFPTPRIQPFVDFLPFPQLLGPLKCGRALVGNVARWKWDGRSLEGDDADDEREPPQRLTEALDRNVDHAAAAERRQ